MPPDSLIHVIQPNFSSFLMGILFFMKTKEISKLKSMKNKKIDLDQKYLDLFECLLHKRIEI